MLRPVHFEIHVDDIERAKKFYTTLFGWTFKAYEGSPMEYLLVDTGKDEGGINGGMMKRNTPIDGKGIIAYVCTMGVPNIDEYMEKAKAAGGTEQFPKSPIPGMGWLAYYKDTEGNMFGMMQMDTEAK